MQLSISWSHDQRLDESVKAIGRVEVPVEVLELARRDFSAERVLDKQVCVLHACMVTEW